ncbi:hypothetical protein LO80_04400 [Candidatus Francisella endociliophora]|uniref:Uncharacterized protein n=2 Tax=Candidatus Francisella endociliophora TaxID=653937 RepID=A0A097ERU0_9GAMM|nr:hypothetical protein LO80_04400 [Francisella sp. FSC1006]
MFISLLAVLTLNSCTSSKAKQIEELQQTQKQLNDQASESLANIDSLKTKIAKYRLQADDLQKTSDSLAKDIDDLKQAYSNFKDPNNDSAIAVSKELTQKTLQKVKLDEKINQYRSQANGYQAQINDLKATSQTQANKAAEISEQISQLKSTDK